MDYLIWAFLKLQVFHRIILLLFFSFQPPGNQFNGQGHNNFGGKRHNTYNGKGIDLLVITMNIEARVLVVINPNLMVLEMATFGMATHLIDKRSFLNVRFV